MIVVEDRRDVLVLWLPPNTPVVRGRLAHGSDFRTLPVAERFQAPRFVEMASWEGPGILKLVPHPPEGYAVWLFWDTDGGFRGWYGNLEEPQRLWTRDDGIRVVDTADQVLDVWCPSDGPPVWKDEDEFAVTTGLPGYWNEVQAAAIRAEGETLMDRARRGAAPFDHSWASFRPDPGWALPRLPADWDRPAPPGP